MRRPTQRQKPQKAKLTSFPAPTGGLVSNRNLALARSPDMPPGAAVMDDWFPTATGAILRRGSIRKASMVEDETVEALFSYSSGNTKGLFAASASGIRDITTVADPDTFSGPDVLTGQTSGNWNVVQFATSGGEFLVGVNGEDEGFLYDGDTFYPSVDGGIYGLDYDALTVSFSVGETVTGGSSSATAEIVKVIESGTIGRLWVKDVTGVFTDHEAITDGAGGSADADGTTGLLASGISFPSGVSKTTADLSYVWVYKQRVWFIERDSLNAWYLPVDQVGGELTLWPMGGVFVRGGALTWAQDWSLDSGGSGGLSEQCVFCTTEGEVAAYQGLSPEVDQGWTKVGVYRTGRPLGDKAFIRAGGDIVIATTVGFVSLAAASRQDYAALGQRSARQQDHFHRRDVPQGAPIARQHMQACVRGVRLPACGQKGGGKRLIGQTKGGINTKLHAVTDTIGRPIRLFITAGHPLAHACMCCRAVSERLHRGRCRDEQFATS